MIGFDNDVRLGARVVSKESLYFGTQTPAAVPLDQLEHFMRLAVVEHRKTLVLEEPCTLLSWRKQCQNPIWHHGPLQDSLKLLKHWA